MLDAIENKHRLLTNYLKLAIPILAVMLALGIVIIIISSSFLFTEIQSNNMNVARHILDHASAIFNEIHVLSLNFGNHSLIKSGQLELLQEEGYSSERKAVEQEFLYYLQNHTNSRPYIHSGYVAFFETPDRFLVSNLGVQDINSYHDINWIDTAMSLRDKRNPEALTVRRTTRFFSFEENQEIITVFRIIRSGIHPVGVVVLNIKPSYFDSLMRRLLLVEGQTIEIYNEQGETIYSYSKGAMLENGDYLKVVEKGSMFSSVSMTPYAQLFKLPIQLSKILLLVIFLLSILVLVITYLDVRWNTRRLEVISGILDAAAKGETIPRRIVRREDEYGYLIEEMIRLFVANEETKIQLIEKKSKFNELELMALQAQINPHFLFNTLETINWEASRLTGSLQNNISGMVQNLSDVLKYSLSNPSDPVTLKEELYYAQCYVAIQQQRYSDTIEVLWDIDQEALSSKGMKLLLQPLIENAIYHGAKEKEASSTIVIRIRRLDEFISLCISDNGTGMKAEQLAMVKLRIEEEGMEESHIGLKNVYKRLKLHYGDSVQFSIDSEWRVGTSITILIPYIPMSDEHNS